MAIDLTGEGGEWATSSAGFIPLGGPDSAISPQIRDFAQPPGFRDVPITSYTFVFNTGGDTKLRLASVRIVPEPESWVLTAALVALMSPAGRRSWLRRRSGRRPNDF